MLLRLNKKRLRIEASDFDAVRVSFEENCRVACPKTLLDSVGIERAVEQSEVEHRKLAQRVEKLLRDSCARNCEEECRSASLL